MSIQLFAAEKDVLVLRAQWDAQSGEPSALTLTTLAWHLRQRDGKRALELADEADALLAARHNTKSFELSRASARLLLVRAEVSLLMADVPAAERSMRFAAERFAELGDRTGLGDAHWVAASIAVTQGDGKPVTDCLEFALREYRMVPDELRVQTVLARQLVYASFHDPVATTIKLEQAFPSAVARTTSLTSWVAAARANVAGLTGDPVLSIKHDLEAYEAAIDSGQLRQAMVCLINVSESFATLGDLSAALQWSETAVTLARSTGWPASLGVCLMQLGDVMRQLGRHTEARAYLEEAKNLMSSQTGSRNYVNALGALGQLALDTQDFTAGLAWFSQLESHVTSGLAPDQLIRAWSGQADALLRLGRAQEAKPKADAALELAREQSSADAQIQVLRILAELHAQHRLPTPPDMTDATPALHYLKLATKIASGISGYTLSPELLGQLASAQAASGDHRSAYDSQLAAQAARNRMQVQEAQKRALTMHIRQEIEQARAETELHRQLALTLKETGATLEMLGAIGLEITTGLDLQHIFQTLHRHVSGLLDATFFAVYLIDNESASLHTAFGVEAGTSLPVITTSLDHPTSMFARCVRERHEIAINRDNGADDPNLLPGTLPALSLLYIPLFVGERVLGAMSIQSPLKDVYGERERSIFRSLCAYGAIALDNAAAYTAAALAQQQADMALHDLRKVQEQLVEQNRQLERLAVTDQLTGLYNRLRLNQVIEEESLRGQRYASNFVLMMIDIDHFKLVNDTFGHQVGDLVLVGIANTLRDSVRQIDMVGRWGGEEFLVLCREADLEGALVLAEKLRSAVQAQVFPEVGHKTISVGVTAFHIDEELATLLARADAALYRAKHGGRNRVECAT